MKNSEQPEDLFDWAQSHQSDQESEQQVPSFTKARPDDGLGWDCKQCELNNGWCERHPRKFESINFGEIKTSLTQEEIESSNKIAEHEAMIQEAKECLHEPATPEEIKNILGSIKKKAS
jgi:hypothetical protein